MDLSGKVAIVTGGGTGIGKAVARRFASAGCAVMVNGRRREPIEEAAAEINGSWYAADVSLETEASALIAACIDEHGRLDVLVNNAGITGPVSTVADIDMVAWDETIATNIRGVILCTKYAVREMMKDKGGSIINMSSMLGLRGYPSRSAYVSTKFAVIGVTQSVAHEVGKFGIRVNALCPGAVHGELMERIVAERAQKEGKSKEGIIKANYTDVAALRKWVKPEDVAEAALFFASDASRSITGESLKVDAGRI